LGRLEGDAIVVLPLGGDMISLIHSGASGLDDARELEWITRIYLQMRDLLAESGLSTLKADQGGFGPESAANREALDLLTEAVHRASSNLERM
jgi:enolase